MKKYGKMGDMNMPLTGGAVVTKAKGGLVSEELFIRTKSDGQH